MPESKRRKPKTTGPTQSKRPTLKEKEESPQWYVALMAAFMGVGVVMVLLRFFAQTDEWVLLVGLAFITVGFVMTTNYR